MEDKEDHDKAFKQADILAPDEIVKNKWKILKKIASGGFGQVYLAVDTLSNARVAIKTESVKAEKQLIKMEVAVFKALKNFDFSPVFLACGRTSKFNFLVMSLVSENIAELRKQQKRQKFTLPTVCWICLQAIQAIQIVHEAGVLHRDVKPSNFAIGAVPYQRHIYVLDFGLARFYRDSDGTHLPPRRSAGFRGTSRYASLSAHKQKELSRRDDLWSLFYMSVELVKGELPWRRLKSKVEIEKNKEAYSIEALTNGLPDGFFEFGQYVAGLQYQEDPDYARLSGLFTAILDSCLAKSDFLLDWERRPTHVSSSSVVSTKDRTSLAAGAVFDSHILGPTPSPQPDVKLSASKSRPVSPSHPVLVGDFKHNCVFFFLRSRSCACKLLRHLSMTPLPLHPQPLPSRLPRLQCTVSACPVIPQRPPRHPMRHPVFPTPYHPPPS